MSVLLITHNLGVVDEIAVEVMVMYAGEIVESATTKAVLHDPLHPYTQGLLRSMPTPERRGLPLEGIRGRVPELSNLPPGCPFHPRCSNSIPACESEHPLLIDNDGHRLRCHNPTPLA